MKVHLIGDPNKVALCLSTVGETCWIGPYFYGWFIVGRVAMPRPTQDGYIGTLLWLCRIIGRALNQWSELPSELDVVRQILERDELAHRPFPQIVDLTALIEEPNPAPCWVFAFRQDGVEKVLLHNTGLDCSSYSLVEVPRGYTADLVDKIAQFAQHVRLAASPHRRVFMALLRTREHQLTILPED